jgi:HAD superfamily hydrolase (TIGR01509 family)
MWSIKRLPSFLGAPDEEQEGDREAARKHCRARAVNRRMNERDHQGDGTVRAVLFDVDGTLVDTNDLHAAAWRETFRHFGHEVDFETVRGQIGKGGDNLIPTLLPDLPEAERKRMETFRSDLFTRDYLPRAVAFPGVKGLFERLYEDGIVIALASSSGKAEVGFHLNLIDCERLVSATTSKDDVESSKPCPDIFEAALAKVAPHGVHDTIVVGDSPWDVKAAARAGLRCVAFRSGGFPDEALLKEGAAALYDGAQDLLERYDSSLFARHAETV